MPYTIYTDPSTRVPEIWSVIPTVTGLAVLSVAIRFWIRARHRGKLWLDDWAIGIAALLSVGLAVDLLSQIRYGYGSHARDLPPDLDVAMARKFLYIGQLLFYLSIGVAKLSILLFYLRLTDALRLPVFCTLAIVSLSTLGMSLSSVLQCVPVSAVWNISVPGKCIDRAAFWIASAAVNIASDILVYVLPLPALSKTVSKMPTRQRVAVAFVFGVGLFVVVTGCLRLNQLRSKILTDDPTWDNVPASLWAVVECNVGIICACMPSMRPLFGRVLGLKGNAEIACGTPPTLSRRGNPVFRRGGGRGDDTMELSVETSRTVVGEEDKAADWDGEGKKLVGVTSRESEPRSIQ